LTKEGRCPFLNDRNLCDIITNLGPDAISMVCDEYPRYFVTVGDYEQMDMSLSCMELGRLFFHGDRMEIRREEDAMSRGDESVDTGFLEKILEARKKGIALLQDGQICAEPDGWKETFCRAALLLAGEADRGEMETIFRETGEDLWKKMTELEPLDASWPRLLAKVRESIDHPESCLQGEWRTEIYGKRCNRWMQRLGVYFLFRYCIDTYYDGSGIPAVRMMYRSLCFLQLLFRTREREEKRALETEDLIDLAHIYSRQVEHSEENVDILKGKGK
jgi:lysine-N-methylase